jgi:hypothetical protein
VIAAFKERIDRFLGRGEAAITIPPFDGALKPNQLLETAAVLAELAAPEDLATDGTSLFASDGGHVLRYAGSSATEVARFDRSITALACLPGGGLVVALAGAEIRITGGPHETFGDSTLTVHYSGMKNWGHLVAVLSANGIPTAISAGACALTGTSGVAQIHFMNESVRVPAGAKFVVTLAATSGNAPVYATGVAAGASVTVGRETLALSVLKRAVSK